MAKKKGDLKEKALACDRRDVDSDSVRTHFLEATIQITSFDSHRENDMPNFQ